MEWEGNGRREIMGRGRRKVGERAEVGAEIGGQYGEQEYIYE